MSSNGLQIFTQKCIKHNNKWYIKYKIKSTTQHTYRCRSKSWTNLNLAPHGRYDVKSRVERPSIGENSKVHDRAKAKIEWIRRRQRTQVGSQPEQMASVSSRGFRGPGRSDGESKVTRLHKFAARSVLEEGSTCPVTSPLANLSSCWVAADAGWPCLRAVICQSVIHTGWRKEEVRKERREEKEATRQWGVGGIVRGNRKERNEKQRERRRVWRRACGRPAQTPTSLCRLHLSLSSVCRGRGYYYLLLSVSALAPNAV